MKPTSERIDRRYSDENAVAVPWADTEARLAAAEVAWIVTVRPDGRPHATPMVPVVHDGKVYFHTGSAEVKYRGRWDGRWRLDIEHGGVVPRSPGTELVVFEMTPSAARGHAKGDPFSHTAYGF